MITSKHGYVGTRKCVKYSGTHEELRDMLKEGDIVTLLWQNDDKSESIKITGTLIEYDDDIALFTVGGEKKLLRPFWAWHHRASNLHGHEHQAPR